MGDAGRRFRGGNGPPLVLIHAALLNWRLWTPVLSLLTAERHVLAPTLAGHDGGPPMPPRGGYIEGAISALIGELDQAGFERPDVVGNSLGGAAALELARRGRARRVVAIAPVGTQNQLEAERLEREFVRAHRLATRIRPVARMVVRSGAVRRLAMRDMVERGDRVAPALAMDILDAVVSCDIGGFFDSMRYDDGTFPTLQDLGEIDVPVLILWGTKDRLVGRNAIDRYMAALPAAQLVELRGLGHCPELEDPERIADEILAFTSEDHPS